MIFALGGNQNSGKTTLFNQLTGSNQHVGNFPGVTVEGKKGTIRNHPDAALVDLRESIPSPLIPTRRSSPGIFWWNSIPMESSTL